RLAQRRAGGEGTGRLTDGGERGSGEGGGVHALVAAGSFRGGLKLERFVLRLQRALDGSTVNPKHHVMPPHEPLVCLAALPPVTLYALGGFIVFMFFVQIVIARWEKRMVWPYGSPEAEPQFPDPSGYGKRWVRNAFEAGFTFYGWCPDLKGPRYRVSYGLLAPPSGDCFVVVGVGTIFSLQLRGTWIYSRTIDGQVFYTTDHQSCVEIDPARRWRNQLTKTDNFPALLKSHRETVRARGIAIQPFDTGHEVE